MTPTDNQKSQPRHLTRDEKGDGEEKGKEREWGRIGDDDDEDDDGNDDDAPEPAKQSVVGARQKRGGSRVVQEQKAPLK